MGTINSGQKTERSILAQIVCTHCMSIVINKNADRIHKYSPCLFLLHFQRAEKVSTKIGMSTKIGICQQKANLRRFIKNSRYSYVNLHFSPRNYIKGPISTPK